MYRITIRATDEAVPPVLLKYMVEQLSQGIEDRTAQNDRKDAIDHYGDNQ